MKLFNLILMFLRYSLSRLQKNFRKRGYHENIIVRRYGKRYFKNHSIYDDFLDIFGLAPTDEYTISTFERNARLSGNTNEIQRILNSVPSASQKDYTFFYHMLSEVTSEDPDKEKLCMFQPEEARAFMEKYRAGNRKIMEKYFHKSEDLFKINFENIKKWEWNSQHMSEDIIHLEQASQTQSKAISDLKEKLKHPAKTILSKVLK